MTRHKGIAAESSFALQMYRWTNKVIEFVDISRKLAKIGIVEIEEGMLRAQTHQEIISKAVAAQTKKSTPRLFHRLHYNQAFQAELDRISEKFSSFDGDNNDFEESKSEYSLQFEREDL